MQGIRWVAAFIALALIVTSPCYAKDEIVGEWHVSHDTHAVLRTSDGGHIAVGELWDVDAGQYDFWVVRVSPDKTITWQKAFGGGGWDIAFSVDDTKDGGYVVAGTTESFGAGDDDFWVLKLNSAGDIVWEKAYGGKGSDYAKSVHETSDGGFIVSGTTSSFGEGWQDFWVLKLDSDGTVAWQKTYGGKDYDTDSFGKMPIQQTSDGGFILGGMTKSFGEGSLDFWILKLNSDGTVAWQKTYGTRRGEEFVTSILEVPGGGYEVTGCSIYGLVFVIRLDPRGNMVGFSTPGEVPIAVFDTSVVPYSTQGKVTETSAQVSDTSKLMKK